MLIGLYGAYYRRSITKNTFEKMCDLIIILSVFAAIYGLSLIHIWQQQINEAVRVCQDADVVILGVGEVTGQGKDATSGEGINLSLIHI